MFMRRRRSGQRHSFRRTAKRRCQKRDNAKEDRREKRNIESGHETDRVVRRKISARHARVTLKSQRHAQPAQSDAQYIGESEGNMIHSRGKAAMFSGHHADHGGRVGGIEDTVGDRADDNQPGRQQPMGIGAQKTAHRQRNDHEQNAASRWHPRSQPIGQVAAERRQRDGENRRRHEQHADLSRREMEDVLQVKRQEKSRKRITHADHQ